MQLYIHTRGTMVRVRNRSFHISNGEEVRMVSAHRVTSMAIGNSCTLSSSALLLALKHHIPVYLLDGIGRISGQVSGTGFSNHTSIRRQQVLQKDSDWSKRYIIDLIVTKLQRQQAHINILLDGISHANSTKAVYFVRSVGEVVAALNNNTQEGELTDLSVLSGWEGQLARNYWGLLSSGLPAGFQFEGRSRMPATDRFNAALNYLYAILGSYVENAIIQAGLDPHFGFMHADGYGSKGLTYDLMEPFRPWADKCLTSLINNDLLKETHFQVNEDEVRINADARRIIITGWNDFLEETELLNDRQVAKKNHFFLLATGLSATLLAQINESNE
ncbi:MAG TPA: CRISPR-associated endonuclease Cas1 [Chitinophagales bacterium]|nr:CRISPR-associated endonuclease Cas1 [Chitinophagales bacterium]